MSTLGKIKARKEAASIIKDWKADGKKVIFTNGCFDVLHAGHVDYLEASRKLGDKLVLGLNSDASIKRIKGDLPAHFGLEARLALVQMLTHKLMTINNAR